MNCSSCGTLNSEGSKFCIKCGQNLNNAVVNTNVQGPIVNNSVNETNIMNPNVTENKMTNNVETVNQGSNLNNNDASFTQNKNPIVAYFFMIIAIILKPFSSLKEELNKFNEIKNSAILSLIISGTATIINLITTMCSAVRVKSFDWSTGDYTTTLVWDNLKNLKYFEIIGKNFLIYLGIIVAIAAVYYLTSLVFKKQSNFSRMLAISALAVTPLFISYLILSPLLSLIWAKLAFLVVIVGALYTLIIVYEGMNSEILVEDNNKYYLNLICLSVLGIAAYWLGMKLVVSSLVSGFNELSNILK